MLGFSGRFFLSLSIWFLGFSAISLVTAASVETAAPAGAVAVADTNASPAFQRLSPLTCRVFIASLGDQMAIPADHRIVSRLREKLPAIASMPPFGELEMRVVLPENVEDFLNTTAEKEREFVAVWKIQVQRFRTSEWLFPSGALSVKVTNPDSSSHSILTVAGLWARGLGMVYFACGLGAFLCSPFVADGPSWTAAATAGIGALLYSLPAIGQAIHPDRRLARMIERHRRTEGDFLTYLLDGLRRQIDAGLVPALIHQPARHGSREPELYVFFMRDKFDGDKFRIVILTRKGGPNNPAGQK